MLKKNTFLLLLSAAAFLHKLFVIVIAGDAPLDISTLIPPPPPRKLSHQTPSQLPSFPNDQFYSSQWYLHDTSPWDTHTSLVWAWMEKYFANLSLEAKPEVVNRPDVTSPVLQLRGESSSIVPHQAPPQQQQLYGNSYSISNGYNTRLKGIGTDGQSLTSDRAAADAALPSRRSPNTPDGSRSTVSQNQHQAAMRPPQPSRYNYNPQQQPPISHLVGSLLEFAEMFSPFPTTSISGASLLTGGELMSGKNPLKRNSNNYNNNNLYQISAAPSEKMASISEALLSAISAPIRSIIGLPKLTAKIWDTSPLPAPLAVPKDALVAIESSPEALLPSRLNHQLPITIHGEEQLTDKGEIPLPPPATTTKPIYDVFGNPTTPITIAVIDTGCAMAHADLMDSIWTNKGEINCYDGIDDDNNGYIDDCFGWDFVDDKPLRDKSDFANIISRSNRHGKEDRGIELTTSNNTTNNKLPPASTAALDHGTQSAGLISGVPDNALGIAGTCLGRCQLLCLRAIETRRHQGSSIEDDKSRGREPSATMTDSNRTDSSPSPTSAVNNEEEEGYSELSSATAVPIIPQVTLDEEDEIRISAALRYAKSMGAKISVHSYGKSGAPLQRLHAEVVRSTRADDHLFVVSAGNNGRDIDQMSSGANDGFYPANFDNGGMIVVGASDRDGRSASFSNYGSQSVDLFAPGVLVLSTVSNDRYDFGSGTSLSSPIVAGAAGLIWSLLPDMSAADIKSAILDGTSPSKDLEGLAVTGGTLNVWDALVLSADRMRRREASNISRNADSVQFKNTEFVSESSVGSDNNIEYSIDNISDDQGSSFNGVELNSANSDMNNMRGVPNSSSVVGRVLHRLAGAIFSPWL